MGSGLFRRFLTTTLGQKQFGDFGAFPPGHYYSPIPANEDVENYLNSKPEVPKLIDGIDLNDEMQARLIEEYELFYKDMPFPEELHPAFRYCFKNDWFSYSDGVFLYCFLRKFKPRKIVEVGSGYSSALMLDTIDTHFADKPEVTFIEPYPERLLGQLREGDRSQVQLIEDKIQNVDLSLFQRLSSNDLLFIDSSHVVKCGSDLQFLMFEVLPKLNEGVFVHFHDIFYPFEYPDEWLAEGRFWNENYFLRAFLSFNSQWKIYFFNSYVNRFHAGLIQEKMPLCSKNPGGSIYIRRES